MSPLSCFKAYDIRGRLGVDLDEGIAYRIGRAFARARTARRVVLGRDVRASSRALSAAVARGLCDEIWACAAPRKSISPPAISPRMAASA